MDETFLTLHHVTLHYSDYENYVKVDQPFNGNLYKNVRTLNCLSLQRTNQFLVLLACCMVKLHVVKSRPVPRPVLLHHSLAQ